MDMLKELKRKRLDMILMLKVLVQKQQVYTLTQKVKSLLPVGNIHTQKAIVQQPAEDNLILKEITL